MRIKYLATILCFFILQSFGMLIGQPGHSISVTVRDAPDTNIRLAYHVGNQQYVRDSITTDKSGLCRFFGSDRLPAGVYMIVLPGNIFFEFLLGEDQHFDILCDINNPAGTLAFHGSDENELFLQYQKRWKELQEEATGLSIKLKGLPQGSAEANTIKLQLAGQEKKMKQFLNETATKNKGTLLGAIARSIIPVETHVPIVPPDSPNPDSVSQLMSYIQYKDHFFDNIDFKEPGLIRSPILGGKIDQFFRQVVMQAPDSIITEADRLLEMSAADKDVFQYVAVSLMNRYATSEIMGQDAVVVHLADKIYLSGNAPWASQEYLADLRKRVERLRPNLIGMKAPELLMSSFAGQYVSLYDVRADFTIIYFWEPDCGHCKEATPMLKDYFEKNRSSGIEVFAVCTQQDHDKWEKYIVDHSLSWINGWDPQRLSRFDYLYNVEATPLIYILDRDKKIIAKRLAVEDIPSFIEAYRKFKGY
ncbi:MAG: thioredoxin-like domain-containing protein [Bacteroidales bacterium]|jgi:thiol-disulfide isomerase/thioredoxin|nr:thioredoxin-like domain-containing protein [Bacteroidales bacterium]